MKHHIPFFVQAVVVYFAYVLCFLVAFILIGLLFDYHITEWTTESWNVMKGFALGLGAVGFLVEVLDQSNGL